MKARLTIYTEDKTSLFFNTVCELELYKNSAQISFLELAEDKRNKIILGINRKKITVLRIIDNYSQDEDNDEKPEEEIFVLSTEKNEPSKAVISFDEIQLYFSTEFFIIKIGKNSVEAELGCVLGLSENKTDVHKIYLKCVLVNPKDKDN